MFRGGNNMTVVMNHAASLSVYAFIHLIVSHYKPVKIRIYLACLHTVKHYGSFWMSSVLNQLFTQILKLWMVEWKVIQYRLHESTQFSVVSIWVFRPCNDLQITVPWMSLHEQYVQQDVTFLVFQIIMKKDLIPLVMFKKLKAPLI